jgi:hypothetical protein
MNQFFKLILVCLVLLFTNNVCFAQFSDDKNWGAFNGNVDSVVITGFNVIKNNIGQPQSKIILEYNKNAKLIHQDAYIVKQPGTADHLLQGISNSYDENGRLNGSIFYNSYNTPVIKEVCAVNNNAFLIEAKRYGIHDNVLIETVQLKLDKDGNILDRSIYDTTSKLQAKLAFTYNDKGQRIEETEFGLSIKPNLRKWIHTYNTDGNLKKQIYYAGADTIIASDIITYSYTKFDSKHNWQVRKVYSKGKLTGIAKRSITYYK